MTRIAAAKANRNDSLVAFADAINLANEVGKLDAFLAALMGAVEPTPAPVQEAKPVKSNDWMKRPASRKQVARTVEMAAMKGKHTMRNVKTGERTPITEANVAAMTAGAVSKLYNALKHLTVKENVTVKPATITEAPVVSVKEARKAQKLARKAARKARQSAPTIVSAIDWDTDGRDDSGYAADDHTSRWIARMERMHV